MTTADLFLKCVLVGPMVEVRDRTGMVIIRACDVTPKKSIKLLNDFLDAAAREDAVGVRNNA